MGSVGPRQAAAFVLDCSKSMAVPKSFTEGSGEYERARTVAPVEVMLQYVRAKIAQRILRDLATTPVTVITYAVKKTKNAVTNSMRAEQVKAYDKSEDAFRNFYDAVPFGQPSSEMLSRLSEVQAGLGPDVDGDVACADAMSGITIGVQTLMDHPKVKNFTKDVFLLTDGESESDWRYLQATVDKMNEQRISLTVIGFNFDDETVNFFEPHKSDIKRMNEEKLARIVSLLDLPSVVATASYALDVVAQPAVKETRSLVVKTTLSLGDSKTYPDRSLRMHVDIKKATTTAPVKSMKKMSLHGFAKRSGAGQASQSQLPPFSNVAASQGVSQSQHPGVPGSNGSTQLPEQGESSKARVYSMGNVGRTLERTLEEAGLELPAEDDDPSSHGVDSAKSHWYRPVAVPKDKLKSAQEEEKKKESEREGKGKGKETEEKGEEEEEEEERWRPLAPGASLTDAYFYGGDLVEMGDMEQGTGQLSGNELGMEIVTFMKQAAMRYDWRLGDVLYVYGSPGQTGSQLLFSALVNGMAERGSCAIVRYIAKGMSSNGVFKVPDPKLGILWPEMSETGLEFCYWCPMPFAEDIRALRFPSLVNRFNHHGVRLEEHKLLPTPAQNDAMSAFVDSMDLSEAGGFDEDGNAKPWLDLEDSFSPAIHNIQNTLIFRLSEPDGELPPVPESIVKYLDPPQSVVDNSKEAREALIAAFDVRRVPPKPKKFNKKVQLGAEALMAHDQVFETSTPTLSGPGRAGDGAAPRAPSGLSQAVQADEMDVDLPLDEEPAAEEEMDYEWIDKVQLRHPISSPAPPATVEDAREDSEPPTEEEPPTEDDEPPTEDDEPPTEDDDEDIEPAPAPIGVRDPLGDFTKVRRARGSAAAVKELVEAAEQLVASSFSTAQYELAVQCLQEARKASQAQVPQIYNDAIRSLVSNTVKATASKRDFGAWIKKHEVGLVVASGYASKGATEKEARLFVQGL